jgi:hypothetical protein
VSVTPLNSVVVPLLVIQKDRVVLAKSTRARAGAFLLQWADLGRFRSNTVLIFSFSFSTRAKEILENCRKMLKMQD